MGGVRAAETSARFVSIRPGNKKPLPCEQGLRTRRRSNLYPVEF